MIYRIAWKHKWNFYTEYGDVEQVKRILDFIEKNIDNGYSLLGITPYED